MNYAILIDENTMYPVSYIVKQNGEKIMASSFLKGGDLTENQIKEYLLEEFYETLKGLVNDVSTLITDNDIEWQQAGYFEHAKQIIKNKK